MVVRGRKWGLLRIVRRELGCNRAQLEIQPHTAASGCLCVSGFLQLSLFFQNSLKAVFRARDGSSVAGRQAGAEWLWQNV
jgi:hypothetical protein